MRLACNCDNVLHMCVPVYARDVCEYVYMCPCVKFESYTCIYTAVSGRPYAFPPIQCPQYHTIHWTRRNSTLVSLSNTRTQSILIHSLSHYTTLYTPTHVTVT